MATMATISRGIKLYRDGEELLNLQEIPELGGDAESIEITTLADVAHMYTEGIKNYGDSIAFKFLYDKADYAKLVNDDAIHVWKVVLPDGVAGAEGTYCNFLGKGSVKLDGVGVNAVLTYTLSVKPTSEMKWNEEVTLPA